MTKLRRRHVIVLALALAGTALAAYVLTPVLRFMAVMRRRAQRADRGRDHLFLQTDYAELLAACRELSRRVASGELEARGNCLYVEPHNQEALSLPRAILDIEPAIIRFDVEGKGQVWIEQRAMLDWFGVVAFPEGVEGSGDVKLIDGLWYRDTDYRDAYPDYMKWIDARIEEGRRFRAERK
jgi:hypothetical protein